MSALLEEDDFKSVAPVTSALLIELEDLARNCSNILYDRVLSNGLQKNLTLLTRKEEAAENLKLIVVKMLLVLVQ
jgi:hypothetical protein